MSHVLEGHPPENSTSIVSGNTLCLHIHSKEAQSRLTDSKLDPLFSSLCKGHVLFMLSSLLLFLNVFQINDSVGFSFSYRDASSSVLWIILQ